MFVVLPVISTSPLNDEVLLTYKNSVDKVLEISTFVENISLHLNDGAPKS
jgi:hypothetical protein